MNNLCSIPFTPLAKVPNKFLTEECFIPKNPSLNFQGPGALINICHICSPENISEIFTRVYNSINDTNIGELFCLSNFNNLALYAFNLANSIDECLKRNEQSRLSKRNFLCFPNSQHLINKCDKLCNFITISKVSAMIDALAKKNNDHNSYPGPNNSSYSVTIKALKAVENLQSYCFR